MTEFHAVSNAEKITLDISDKPVKVPPAVMNNNIAIKILNTLLVVSVLVSAVLSAKIFFQNREYRSLQRQLAQINRNSVLTQALINDCLEYSKKNPAIDPILESVGVKTSRTAATATKPVTK